ncbi:MAG: ribonuclease HII [Nanoarchaeota archaeon]|nr:ribonuclease HII [Nanoarchaeota archaeon]
MITAGVDEAGRGPVIGPLVMAGVSADEEGISRLKKLGVKDSKLLKPSEREFMFREILGIVKDYKIISITPDRIDACLADENDNLNRLEARTTSEILNSIPCEKAIIDLPEKDAAKYCSYIRENLANKKIELVAEHKADLNYPIVSAASILAKVTRDRYIELLKEQFGEDFGSGYMSDVKTSKFLEKHWNNDRIYFFRKEWKSWKNLKIAQSQKRLFDF